MLPKSHRKAYVGYDGGSNSVLYYNAETRKILTSRNHRFLTSPASPQSTKEEIEITPNNMREGEEDGSTRANERESAKRKVDQMEQPISESEPRRTRGIRTNYKYLNDPFPDELEAAQIAIEEGDTPEPIRRRRMPDPQ
jgi:hypothetical protein